MMQGTYTLYNEDKYFTCCRCSWAILCSNCSYLWWWWCVPVSIMIKNVYFVDLVLVDWSTIHDAVWAQRVLTAKAFAAVTADQIKFSMKALIFYTCKSLKSHEHYFDSIWFDNIRWVYKCCHRHHNKSEIKDNHWLNTQCVSPRLKMRKFFYSEK